MRNGLAKDSIKTIQNKPKKTKLTKKRKRVHRGRNKRKKKKTKANLKHRREKQPVTFFKKMKVPGKSTTLTVSSRNVENQIDFLYLGKSYHLTLKEIMEHLGKSLKPLLA